MSLVPAAPLAVLPPRPNRLSLRYYGRRMGIFALLALGIAVLAALTTWVLSDVPRVLDERAVWATGTPAVDGDIGGKSQSKALLGWLLSAYTLEARFLDEAGAWHTGESSFFTVLGSVDTAAPPEIRYDPADPTRYAVNWAVEATGARARAVVVLGLFFGAATVLVVRLAFEILFRATPERLCAVDGVERVGRVERDPLPIMAEGKPTKTWTVVIAVPTDDGGETSHLLEFRYGIPPLYLDDRERTVLVLRSPRNADAVVLVRSDFYPFGLTKEQLEAASHRVAVLQREARERGGKRV